RAKVPGGALPKSRGYTVPVSSCAISSPSGHSRLTHSPLEPVKNDDLLQDFIVESNEHLAGIEAELLAIESQVDDLDIDLVNKVFRALHSIKGASGFLGLDRICELSHKMENVLNSLRNLSLPASSRTIETLLKSSDCLKGMLEDIGSSDSVDILALVSALDIIQSGSKKSGHATAKLNAGTSQAGASSTPSAGEVKLAKSTTSQTGATVRVSVRMLDHLMNLAGELVLGRNQLIQTINSDDKSGLDTVSSRIDQITSELQEAIMDTRMQPVGNVFIKFPRVVRDLAASLGKQVQLSTEGTDVELDRRIIEALGDPLTHLVRNSVDHGVETPADRRSLGKPAMGTILLRAFHDGGTVNIQIKDDGGGIDAELLKKKAIEKGIISRERARVMNKRDALRLIFHPGFTTKDQVSDISGRGVGMDVVLTNIQVLGGTIEIDSEQGVGTTIGIKLPLTLAIIPALIVRSGMECFALPQLNIVELVRVREGGANSRIKNLKGAEVLRLRGKLLPLLRLRKILAKPTGDSLVPERPDSSTAAGASGGSAPSQQTSNIIVVSAGQIRYGLVVDELRDSEEIVVKPLGRHIKDAPCFTGATILGDGQIALILDVAGIASFEALGARLPEELAAEKEIDEGDANGGCTQSVMVFQNHPGEQFAVLTDSVARIERVRTESLVVVGGVEAIQGPNDILPVLRLSELVTAIPFSYGNNVYVIVVEAAGREIGLIVSCLVDIRDITKDVDTVTIREPGITGSVTLDGFETRLVDVAELAQRQHPQWFPALEPDPIPVPEELAAVACAAPEFTAEAGVLDVEWNPAAASEPSLTTTEEYRVPDAVQAPVPQPQAGLAQPQTPVPVVEPERTPSAPQPCVPDQPSGPPLVLVVEDSGFFRKKMISYLRERNFEVVDCVDGQEAWDLLQARKHNIQLVVTDIEMPHMTGLELTEAIRGNEHFADLPVIALSSLATDEDIASAREKGVSEYQVKLDRDRLLGAIQRLWDARMEK
ncbi:MAG: two-component system chemotaxis sensor kinase CheA, partial [Candidatus Paceibacteria bacterium]